MSSNNKEIVDMFRGVPLKHFRNIGVAAHIDSGKTTFTERVLVFTGRIRQAKEVHEGEATMDYMTQEKERGITITSAATTCIWDYCRLNIIDTPGHVDFTIEVERAMRVLDGIIAVYDGVAGVEPQSETVWHQANKYNLPRICFVNKMDRQGADFSRCVQQIKDRLFPNVIILSIPVGIENDFNGIIDILGMKYLKWNTSNKGMTYDILDIPDEYLEKAQQVREETIQKVIEMDSELTEKFINGEEIILDEIHSVIRKNVISNNVVPAICGSALKNVGIQFALDLINKYFPSPLEVPTTYGYLTEKKTKVNEKIVIPMTNDHKLTALIFKTQYNKNLGNVAYIRIYSGVIKKGTNVFNPNKNITERISRIVLVDANKFYDVEEGYAGEVLAILFREHNSCTGDTIASIDYNLQLENIQAPLPVIAMSIEAGDKKDTMKLGEIIKKMTFDDPSLKFSFNEYKQLIIEGMGELHLQIVADRIREMGVDVKLGQPQVSYKVTIKNEIEEQYVHKKQTGGAGEFADMTLKLVPQERGAGFKFVNSIVQGRIPTEYIPSIREGLEEAAHGGIDKFPVVDVVCELLDGSFHSVDSNSTVFRNTSFNFFKLLVKKAGMLFLEPIMKVHITFPVDFYGVVTGDVSKKRGLLVSTNDDESRGYTSLVAHIPLSEMFGYVDKLRSITKGYGQYSMALAHYSEVPEALVDSLVYNQQKQN